MHLIFYYFSNYLPPNIAYSNINYWKKNPSFILAKDKTKLEYIMRDNPHPLS